ncbi:hypothetical protein [Qipengyuania flava]|uniref:hypothetical protein n=1 Tax=Qipengyuania flava TaxID=192812 RepID=UPI003BAFD495
MDSEAGEHFAFSESVVQFYTRPELRAAVELLVDDAFVFPPDKDDWGRVETYYDACLAAQQTKIELAKDMHRLWISVWKPIPEDWVSVAAKAKDQELSLDPDIRWDEGYFERHFRFGNGLTAAIWVSFDDDEVELAFTIKRNNGVLTSALQSKKGENLPNWVFKNDAVRLAVDKPYASGLDLIFMQAEAEAAIEFIKSYSW